MKNYRIVLLFFLSTLFLSCKEKGSENVATLDPVVDVNQLKTDFTSWWTYHYQNIALSSNFTGLSETSETMNKKQFLEKLNTGNYIPLKLASAGGATTYQLSKLDATTDDAIRTTIKNQALISLSHLEMEGTLLPEFNFTDLKGNVYTNETTKGKTLVLKAWFISCAACVAEFPELNAFVEKSKNRDDILFVSMAFDTKAALENFLQKRPFAYAVVPDQKEFLESKLHAKLYPTHYVVNKDGNIVKVFNKASELIAFVENEMR